MDDLSNKLNNGNAGCIIGSSLINHLMYADDLVLMVPSFMSLSMLVSVCSEYGIEHDIKYNSNKSNVMIFSCKRFYMCTESVKCTLFKSYCTSLYTYASCGVAIEQSQ